MKNLEPSLDWANRSPIWY